MNIVKIAGNICRDIDFRMLGANGIPKATTAVAVEEEIKGKKIVNYINIEAWNNNADVLSMYSKGQKIALTGKLVTGSYQKQDGSKVYTWAVQVSKIEGNDFVKHDAQQVFANDGTEVQISEDDLPF